MEAAEEQGPLPSARPLSDPLPVAAEESRAGVAAGGGCILRPPGRHLPAFEWSLQGKYGPVRTGTRGFALQNATLLPE